MHSTRIAELGITLPDVAAPVAAYVPALQVGNQVWTSGQLPFVDGVLRANLASGGRTPSTKGSWPDVHT